MIFPFLNGILDFRQAPVTWLLVFMNLMVFGLSSGLSGSSQKSISDIVFEEQFIVTQGRLYAEYLRQQPEGQSLLALRLAERVRAGDKERSKNLGYLASRDQGFFGWVDEASLQGDLVALRLWKESHAELERIKDRHPSFILGLGSGRMDWSRWFSYMFTHGSLMHFLGNMLFLLIFGCMLEPLLGGLRLLLVYLLGGLGAGAIFVLWDGPSLSPLVGASGSVSALVGLFCVLHWSQPVRYIYWLFLPVKGYLGFIYLPAWVVLLIWLISDLAGFWGGISELGGIAHTAHIGGQLVGLALGLAFLWWRPLLQRSFQPLSAQSKMLG